METPGMDTMSKLEAIEQIKRLKARYFRFMDTKQWAEMSALFTSDLKIITPSGDVWMEGGDSFIGSLRGGLQESTSCHQGFMPEIEIVDADNATGIWAMQDTIEWKDRHPREGWKSIFGQGHYHETYRRTDDGWRIATLSLTRLRLDIVQP